MVWRQSLREEGREAITRQVVGKHILPAGEVYGFYLETKLLEQDVVGPCRRRPLQLEPARPRPRSTAPGTGGIRSHDERWLSGAGERGYPVPVPGNCLSPLEIRPELTVESDVVVWLGGTRGEEQVDDSPEECSPRSHHPAGMLEGAD